MSNPASLAITQWLTMLSGVTRSNGIPEGYTYAGIGDFLLQHGTWYEPRPLPKRVRPGTPMNCFHNALKLCKTRRYTYVEGYAIPEIDGLLFPVHHAWNLDRAGHLVDNTWRDTGRAYLGVEFPLDAAKEALSNKGNTVLDNWITGHEIFKEPYMALT